MTWLSILEHAISSPSGTAVLCFNPEKADQAKRQLYQARAKAREAEDLRFDGLSISMAPHSNATLYVYTKGQGDSPYAVAGST